jgi:antitoxin PrlF
VKRTLKISPKGQITFRKEVLDQLGVRPGGKITMEFVAPGSVKVTAAQPKAKLERFVGSLKATGIRTVSVEDMREIVRKAWADKK